MPNSWRIILSCMEIWLESTKGDMIRVDKFAYLYRLKESKEYGYYELVPWDRIAYPRPSDTRSPGFSLEGKRTLEYLGNER